MSAVETHPGEAATRTVLRGAGTNALGLAARVVDPLFQIFITRVFGPAVVGVYKTAVPVVESAATLTVAGYQDGIIAYAGRHLGRGGDADRAYDIMANALVVSGVVSAGLGVLAFAGGPGFLRARFGPELLAGGLVAWVQLMIFAVPLLALVNLVAAATKTLLIMRYHAAVAPLRTGLMFLAAAAAALLGLRRWGLPLAYLGANLVLAAAAVAVFARHFALARLAAALARFRWSGELTRFALPQNLNMALATLLPQMGTLLLGVSGTPAAEVAFYAAGAEIIQAVRQIRITASSAFAPMIVRLHADGRIEELRHTLSRLMAWTLRLSIPAVLALVIFRREILGLWYPAYARWDSRFMLLLAVVPLLNSASGFAGNVVVMTGHSRWNLLNSVIGLAVTAAVSWLLIPRYGLLGAAAGAAAAVLATGFLELWEARWLLGIRPRLAIVAPPLVAGAAAVALCAATWPWLQAGGFGLRLLQGALAATAYVGALRLYPSRTARTGAP
jgi:O-antigen/teichoic acid export membrane protein